MAQTTAEIGYGIKFKRGDGAETEVFTELGELIDITPPALATDDIDASHHGSPNAGKEYIAGMIEPGEIALTIVHVPGDAANTQLNSDQLDRQSRNWQIEYVKGGNTVVDTYYGYVKSNTPTTPLNDRMTSEVVIKVAKLDPQRTITPVA
ncbi:MAG: phage tail tube protein [Abyssibacter sp.]|uniref:phage tail tube protein n=1 Tax=Abyssibacter sp. TaxID=2320200 RepID=UPI003219CB58